MDETPHPLSATLSHQRIVAGPGTRHDSTTTVGVFGGESLTRLALSSVVEECTDLKLVGETSDLGGLVDLALRHRPDVLIAYLVEVPAEVLSNIVQLRVRRPQTRTLALAAGPADDLVFRALSSGVIGLLARNCSPQELTAGVRAAATGEITLASSLTQRLLRWFDGVDVGAAKTAGDRIRELRRAESEVLGAVTRRMEKTRKPQGPCI